jgi:hypothetical protein
MSRVPDVEAVGRVRTLVAAAGRLADPGDPLGARARAVLPAATGLSPQGVIVALERCLETAPSDAEVGALVGSVPAVSCAHVVLSAGVFVAAHRAIARGLAASSRVFVKPSRRDPEMTALLALAAPGLFTVVERVAARPGDQVFAYGSDEALHALAATLPPSTSFEGHGPGIGIAFADVRGASAGHVEKACRLLADDVALFDQRGCLSPRIAFVSGTERETTAFAEALAGAFAAVEAQIPLGHISAEEAAARVRYRDTVRYAGDVFQGGAACVGVDVRGGPLVVPPTGRNVHVVRAADPSPIEPLRALVTAVGVHGPPTSFERVRAVLPRARVSAFGRMQTPPFDGPVDLRDYARAADSG